MNVYAHYMHKLLLTLILIWHSESCSQNAAAKWLLQCTLMTDLARSVRIRSQPFWLAYVCYAECTSQTLTLITCYHLYTSSFTSPQLTHLWTSESVLMMTAVTTKSRRSQHWQCLWLIKWMTMSARRFALKRNLKFWSAQMSKFLIHSVLFLLNSKS